MGWLYCFWLGEDVFHWSASIVHLLRWISAWFAMLFLRYMFWDKLCREGSFIMFVALCHGIAAWWLHVLILQRLWSKSKFFRMSSSVLLIRKSVSGYGWGAHRTDPANPYLQLLTSFEALEYSLLFDLSTNLCSASAAVCGCLVATNPLCVLAWG